MLTQESGTTPGSAAVPWGLRQVLWGSLLALGLFGAAVVGAALAGSVSPTPGGQLSVLQAAIVALSELAFLAGAWAFGAHRAGWPALGFRRFAPLGCLAAAGLLLVTLVVNAAWGLFLQYMGWQGQPDVAPLFGHSLGGRALAFLAMGVVAPLAEEAFFRGFVFPPFRQRLGLWVGVGIDAALFGLLHFTPSVFPPIFVMGAIFCLLYYFTDSLWPGILLHATINTFALVAAFATTG